VLTWRRTRMQNSSPRGLEIFWILWDKVRYRGESRSFTEEFQVGTIGTSPHARKEEEPAEDERGIPNCSNSYSNKEEGREGRPRRTKKYGILSNSDLSKQRQLYSTSSAGTTPQDKTLSEMSEVHKVSGDLGGEYLGNDHEETCLGSFLSSFCTFIKDLVTGSV